MSAILFVEPEEKISQMSYLDLGKLRDKFIKDYVENRNKEGAFYEDQFLASWENISRIVRELDRRRLEASNL